MIFAKRVMRYGVKPFLYEISSTILNVSNNGFYRYLKQDFVPLSRVSLYESNVVIDVINTYSLLHDIFLRSPKIDIDIDLYKPFIILKDTVSVHVSVPPRPTNACRLICFAG